MPNIIRYSGDKDILVWKYHYSFLEEGSILEVNETQEAVFMKNGEIYDIFTPGTYTLNSESLPRLNHSFESMFKKKTFEANIWFINTTTNLDIKWGTPTPIQIQDPKYNVFIPLRSYGQLGIQIVDASKFMLKLVGNVNKFDKESLLKYFKGLCLMFVKDIISVYVIHKKISVMEINAYMEELSKYVYEKLIPYFATYGIQLINFCINDISVPENDTTVIKIKEALAKKAEMKIVGYNYEQKRSFDTLQTVAELSLKGKSNNEINNVILDRVSTVLDNQQTKECPNCKTKMLAKKRYCSDCGFDTEKNEPIHNNVVCNKCGTEYSRTSKYCPECGTSLIKRCPNCQNIVKKEQKFCVNCGTKLGGF